MSGTIEFLTTVKPLINEEALDNPLENLIEIRTQLCSANDELESVVTDPMEEETQQFDDDDVTEDDTQNYDDDSSAQHSRGVSVWCDACAVWAQTVTRRKCVKLLVLMIFLGNFGIIRKPLI